MDSSTVNPEIEDQGAELGLIAALVPSLEDRSAIDVGSERGAVAASLREAGLDPTWLIEPFPGSVTRLRERFGADPGVHILNVAAGAGDGTADLHLARDVAGGSLDAFHTLRPDRAGPGLAWDGSVQVPMRSLDSLSAAGEVPERVGLLKIDAEGADADVLRGATSIRAEIVMVEFWGDLPDTLGPCPFELEEIRSLVEHLGPKRFLFVRHGARHLSIGRWDTADPAEEEWGNLVFMAEPLVEAAEAALPTLERELRERNERFTAEQEAAAAERLELIERLTREAEERLELVERLTREAEERGRLVQRLSAMMRKPPGDSSGGPGALDAFDDVEQEGGGDRSV